jgi:hypothetical protein
MELISPAKQYSTSKNSRRVSFIEYLFVLMLIIYAGHAIKSVASTSILENPVWAFFPVFLSGILALKWRIIFNKQFYILISCFFIYFFAISIKYNEFRPSYFINYVFIFFTVYVTIKALKINLFRIYESLLYILAIIGLMMWGLEIILGGDTLYNYFGKIPSIETFSNVSGNGLNAVLYSVQPTSASMQFDFLPPRNCGFAWEPGGFATFLCLAIFINLFFLTSDKNSNIRFWVLLFALVSTQSTTGYVIFLVIILIYYYNKKRKLAILLWPALLALIILVFSLPFMSDKIVSLAKEAELVDVMVEGSIGRETSIAPQRFASFIIAFRDFLDNPILGLGGNAEESWTSKVGANVSTITGIGNLLAQHGLVGLLFFLIASYKSSCFYAKSFNYQGKVLFFIIIFFISISYGIILLPLLMSFWMFQLFTPRNFNQEEIAKDLNTESELVVPQKFS